MPHKKTKPEECNEDMYLTLSATDESSIQAYYSALDFALSQDSVENIGVIGAHASGKTSVLRSYNKHCKEHKTTCRIPTVFKKDYVYITLGDYVRHMSDNDGEEQEVGHHSTTSELQHRIIEQLLCYNPPYRAWRSTIPLLEKTFKRFAFLGQVIYTVLISIVVFAVLIGFNFFGATNALQSAAGLVVNQPTNTMEVTSREESSTTTEDGKRNTVVIKKEEPAIRSSVERLVGCSQIVCLLVISFVAAWQIMKLYNAGITIRGMTIGGNSINMEKDDLPFDTQIDNLLYLLRCTKSHVMVFEDVDRVDDRYEILTNLRELCFELNVVERISKRGLFSRIPFLKAKPYKFIYCLEQEGIPSTEERTKFFDFIVEMVPYGDYTNFGGLLDNFLRSRYKINRVLLDYAGRTMTNTRECEHMANAFILRQKVLAENNRFTAASEVPPSFNNMVFALVAYKCMYPADYTRLSHREGFLFEALQSYSKEAVLTSISNKPDIDALQPYVALVKKYGGEKTWNDSFLDVLETLPSAPTRKEIITFVKFALEHGYINERYETYTSLWRGEMDENDRRFCLYADARLIDQKGQNTWWTRQIKDPIGVLNWLGYWSVAENKCVLNFSLLDYLLDANCNGTLDADGKRILMALTETIARDEKLLFHTSYLARCNTSQLLSFFIYVNSQTDIGDLAQNLNSLQCINQNPESADSHALVLLSHLRAVSAAKEADMINAIVPDKKLFIETISETPTLLKTSVEPWLEVSDSSVDDNTETSKFISQNIAHEVTEGLLQLDIKLNSLEHTPENIPLVKAIIKQNCYEITPENVTIILRTILTEEELLRLRFESIIGLLLYIAENNTDYSVAIYSRMQSDFKQFIKVAILNASTQSRLYRDNDETIYFLLNEEHEVPNELLKDFLKVQHKKQLTYDRIENKEFRSQALPYCEPTIANLEAYLREHSDRLDDASLDFIIRILDQKTPTYAILRATNYKEFIAATDEQREYLKPIIDQAASMMIAKGYSDTTVARAQELLDE